MKFTSRMLLVSLLATLVVWAAYAWPLPRHVFTGIPSSAHNVEKGQVRRMLPGDHLQLHYFYWIFSDMLAGGTPFWHNLYEFNTGDDAARRQVGNYSMPLSFIYAAGRLAGGDAFGWNLTGFMTLWGTLVAAWLLIGRFTGEVRFSLVCSLLALALPYRWMTLLGGSPTGFAMLWVPVLFLGLDMAGRDDSFKGSLLASAALMLAYWNDPHTFFFSVLSIPVGYLYGFVRRETFPWQIPSGWEQVCRGVLPVAVMVVGLGVVGMAVKNATFSGTNMGGGRGLHEIMLFTPRLRGLLGWRANPADNQIYIGYALLALFGSHLIALPYLLRRRPVGSRLWHGLLMLLLYGSMSAVALLAMGPQGPFSAILFRGARRLLPGYSMIRQTGKIYALMPVVLAVAAAVAGMDLMALFRRRRPAVLAMAAIPVLVACVEFRAVVRPTVCLLDGSQPAYAAVRRDADQDVAVANAHVLVIPLWPGDSHWASLYQHYASLYRIRMVNGYSPIVSDEYRERVYRRFEDVNGGGFHDGQLDALLGMGVHYVIFHEDAFPEQVSAYPAVLTLRRLLNHPRLQWIGQGGSVWSFKILKTSSAVSGLLPDGPYFPSRRWNAAACLLENGDIVGDETTWGGAYARVREGGSLRMRGPFNHMYAPDPRLWIRGRGPGVCRFHRLADDPEPVLHRFDTGDWTWIALPLPVERQAMHLGMDVIEGVADIDMMTLVAGGWELPIPGDTVSLPGCLFFRSGYTKLPEGSVKLRPDYDAASDVFYGPRLPFPPGTFRVTLRFASDAAPGTLLGRLVFADGDTPPLPVRAGSEAVATYRHRVNLPLEFRFVYTRGGGIEILAMEIEMEAGI